MSVVYMKSLSLLAIVFVSAANVFTQPPSIGIEDLGWLAGCWESRNAGNGRVVSEQWMKPEGGTIIGMGRTVRDGRTTDYEFVRIVQEKDGIFYIAKPMANREETRFRLVRSGVKQAVFENIAHDFPQRVIYKLEKNMLAARIEGMRNGKLQGFDFPMSETSCRE